MAADPVGRGTARLRTAYGHDLVETLRRAVETFVERGVVAGIVTGFCIVGKGIPPEAAAAETDGPPGAIALARTIIELGGDAVLITDDYGAPVVAAGCEAAGLPRSMILTMPFEEGGLESVDRLSNAGEHNVLSDAWAKRFFDEGIGRRLTHLIAVERAGPSHTLDSAVGMAAETEQAEKFLATVPARDRDACHNMRGDSINAFTAKTHRLFDLVYELGLEVTTIAAADGGNEIGFGSTPWDKLAAAIKGDAAARIACRIPVDHLLIAGVSDWGAYALVAGIRSRIGTMAAVDAELELQQRALEAMAGEGGAIDGITLRHEPSVDSLPLARYLAQYQAMLELVEVG